MPIPEHGHPIPPIVHDRARLDALAEYGIIDSPREQEYDAITRLIAHVCETPYALISLVEDDRQWFKSACNFGDTETPLNMSICAHAIAGKGLLEIPDARVDERTNTNPLVAGSPHIRFYAGSPLVTPSGQAIGSLCVIDTKPRQLTPAQRDALKTLGDQVINLLELRRQLRLKQSEIERREILEADLNRAKDAAEASSRAKDRFFASLSHELRTPLTPVLITAAAMADDETAAPSVREVGRMIQRNVQHEVRLIDDLLDVSRIINGKIDLVTQPLDLHTVVDECVAMCAPEAREKSQDVSIGLRATRPFLRGDAARLKQVLCNLIRNAIRYTPANGKIKIETLDVVSGNGQTGGDTLGTAAVPSVRVEVSDTGMGMRPDKVARMFEPFEQGEGSSGSGGLGLGLAIAKGFIEAHGGRISGHSDGPGHGSTFTIEVPSSSEPVTQTPAANRPDQAGLRILLVEDHDDSRRAMKRLLTVLKHTVDDSATVADAQRLAAEQAFDLIISDVGLPDGSGLDLMRHLRRHCPMNATVRGIALTGYGTEADITAARDAGFATHLTKPINFAALQDAIRRVAE